MLTSAAGDRINVPNLIVILTDGPSTDPLAADVSVTEHFPTPYIEKNVLTRHRDKGFQTV